LSWKVDECKLLPTGVVDVDAHDGEGEREAPGGGGGGGRSTTVSPIV
jgi:hypothetical protein